MYKASSLNAWETACILEALNKFEGAHKEHKEKLIKKLEQAREIIIRIK